MDIVSLAHNVSLWAQKMTHCAIAKLELAEADLLDEESLFKAIEGAKYVVHTASPFVIIEPKDENDLIGK